MIEPKQISDNQMNRLKSEILRKLNQRQKIFSPSNKQKTPSTSLHTPAGLTSKSKRIEPLGSTQNSFRSKLLNQLSSRLICCDSIPRKSAIRMVNDQRFVLEYSYGGFIRVGRLYVLPEDQFGQRCEGSTEKYKPHQQPEWLEGCKKNMNQQNNEKEMLRRENRRRLLQ